MPRNPAALQNAPPRPRHQLGTSADSRLGVITASMALVDDFTAAQSRALELSRPPTTDEMLELYALYKQATAGDANSKRPGMLDFKGRAKYDAWAERKGMSPEVAMQGYVDLVAKLVKKYG